jgi:hypothetical protein
MVTEPTNPLAKHFRQPAVYLDLPSKGNYWPEGSLELGETGQLPVYPMTVKDEMVLKTPDALLNGQGTVNTLQSCCPSIKNAWKIPACDLDAILIAIRLASFGEELELSSQCEHCKETNDHIVDLKVLLENMKEPVFDKLDTSDLTIQFKPQLFETLNNSNLANFQTQRLISTIMSSELSEEEKTAQFNSLLPNVTDLNVSVIADSIEYIAVNKDTTVTNKEHIVEFLNNCDRKLYDKLQKHVEKLATQNRIQPFDVQCKECEKPYKTSMTFEFSNFFG